MNNLFILSANPNEGNSGMSSLIMMGLIIIVFYFFMIQPQRKKQKEAKKFMENIKKGDKVVTIGGIQGKIQDIHDNYYLLEIADGVKIKVLKTAISMDGSAALNQIQ